MAHEPRLNRELAQLLGQCRVGALGTTDEQGFPFVSMTPWALEPGSGHLVLHVSGLAAHARHLRLRPEVCLLVVSPEQPAEPVHALHRVSLQGTARFLAPEDADAAACRAAYLSRFPEAEPMTELGDFRFVALHIRSARQVAGFGAARSLDEAQILAVLQRAQAKAD